LVGDGILPKQVGYQGPVMNDGLAELLGVGLTLSVALGDVVCFAIGADRGGVVDREQHDLLVIILYRVTPVRD
jgi:hypothetical protein